MVGSWFVARIWTFEIQSLRIWSNTGRRTDVQDSWTDEGSDVPKVAMMHTHTSQTNFSSSRNSLLVLGSHYLVCPWLRLDLSFACFLCWILWQVTTTCCTQEHLGTATTSCHSNMKSFNLKWKLGGEENKKLFWECSVKWVQLVRMWWVKNTTKRDINKRLFNNVL